MRKPCKKDMNQGDLDEDELKQPEVYFIFAMSCNIELEDLLNRISFYWGELKGRRLQIKDLPYFTSETPFVLFTKGLLADCKSIIRELTMILKRQGMWRVGMKTWKINIKLIQSL